MRPPSLMRLLTRPSDPPCTCSVSSLQCAASSRLQRVRSASDSTPMSQGGSAANDACFQQQQQTLVLRSAFLGRIAAMEAAAEADSDDEVSGYSRIGAGASGKSPASGSLRERFSRLLFRRSASAGSKGGLRRHSEERSQRELLHHQQHQQQQHLGRSTTRDRCQPPDCAYTRWGFLQQRSEVPSSQSPTPPPPLPQQQQQQKMQRQLVQQQQQLHSSMSKSVSARTVRFHCPYEEDATLVCPYSSTAFSQAVEASSSPMQRQQQQQQQQPSVSSGYGSDQDGGCCWSDHWAVREEDIDSLLQQQPQPQPPHLQPPLPPRLPIPGDADDVDVKSIDLGAIFLFGAESTAASAAASIASAEQSQLGADQIDRIVRDVVRLKAASIGRQVRQQLLSSPGQQRCRPAGSGWPAGPARHQRHASASPLLLQRQRQPQPPQPPLPSSPGGARRQPADWSCLELAQFR